MSRLVCEPAIINTSLADTRYYKCSFILQHKYLIYLIHIHYSTGMGSVNKSGGKFTEKTLLASLFFVDNQCHNNKVGFGMCAVADAVAFTLVAECHVAGEQLHFRAVVIVFGGAA